MPHCRSTPHRGTPCLTMPGRVTLSRHVMPECVTPCHTMSSRVSPCQDASHCHTTSCYFSPHHTISHHVTLCQDMSRCVTPCYAMQGQHHSPYSSSSVCSGLQQSVGEGRLFAEIICWFTWRQVVWASRFWKSSPAAWDRGDRQPSDGAPQEDTTLRLSVKGKTEKDTDLS